MYVTKGCHNLHQVGIFSNMPSCIMWEGRIQAFTCSPWMSRSTNIATLPLLTFMGSTGTHEMRTWGAKIVRQGPIRIERHNVPCLGPPLNVRMPPPFSRGLILTPSILNGTVSNVQCGPLREGSLRIRSKLYRTCTS